MQKQNWGEPSPEMVIDAVDLHDNVVGNIKRKNVLDSYKNFRVAHIFLFNRKGELLIQKISKKNTRHPFYWGSSVAGYLFAGEDYKTCALRRLKQELGIESNIKFFGKVLMKEETGNKMIELFTCTYNGKINFNSEIILKTEFHSLSNIELMLNNSDRSFTPTFNYLFNFFKAQVKL